MHRAKVLATIASVVVLSSAIAQEQPRTTVIFKSTTTAKGQPIVFPGANTEVTGSIGERPPGWVSEWHKHPFPRYHYVLEGVLTVEDEDGNRTNFLAGSLSIEQINTWHRAMNLGSTTAKWLFIDSCESGRTNVILRDK